MPNLFYFIAFIKLYFAHLWALVDGAAFEIEHWQIYWSLEK